MTVREFLEKSLVDRMLFPAEAKGVVDAFVLEPSSQSIRFDTPIEGYPSQFRPVLICSLDRAALKWIDFYKPSHFARPMFEHKSKEG